MRCPDCQREIEDNARKCRYCGSWVAKGPRRFQCARSIVEFLTFIAAIGVLGVMLCQNSIMKETVNQMRQDIDLQKSYLQPRLDIDTPAVTITDSSLVIKYYVTNIGQADAESIFALVTYRIPGKKDISFPDTLDKITVDSRKIFKYTLKPVFKYDFYSKIEIKYNWQLFKQDFADIRYYEHNYDKKSDTYSTYRMRESRVKEVWF